MNKKVIGITGGIGCGKSVVMDLLQQEYGAAVLLADTVGHELMEPGKINYEGILSKFGKEILNEDGQIDRKKLGACVFSDDSKLELLNQITHQNIIEEIKQRIQLGINDPKIPFVCLESAILLTTDLEKLCDEIWYVYAREEVRIQRLIAGRGYTEEYCKSVMEKQTPEAFYRERADVILDNSGNVDETKRKLAQLLCTR